MAMTIKRVTIRITITTETIKPVDVGVRINPARATFGLVKQNTFFVENYVCR